jgi:hypothetical protein
MPEGWQRQRHGVSKNLVEGIGGALIGAAAVLLLRQWLRPAKAAVAAESPRHPPAEPAPAAAASSGAGDTRETPPKSRSKRRPKGTLDKE